MFSYREVKRVAMEYKFLKITSFYREYLQYYYSANESISGKSYNEQYRHLMYDSFGWADYYQKYLRKIDVDAYEIVYNAEPLQQAWAREHNIQLRGKELLLYQINSIKPDVILFQDSNTFNGPWIDIVREKNPSVRLIIGSCCSPFSEDQLRSFSYFDLMITCAPHFQQRFNEHGIKSYQLWHGFDPDVLQKIKPETIFQDIDISFTGSFIQSEAFHDDRVRIIESLLKSHIPLRLYSTLNIDRSPTLLLKQGTYLATTILKKIGLGKFIDSNATLKKFSQLNTLPHNPQLSSTLKAAVAPPVFGLNMFSLLAKSKLSLNIHGGVSGAYAANIRMFEVTGVGSCLVTDWKKNLGEMFDLDREVVAFKSIEECIEKVRWLLGHPMERKEIAVAGQRRTLRDHSFEKRALRVDEIIRQEMKK